MASCSNSLINTCVNKVPSVYLFRLGTVEDLRKQLYIPQRHADNCIVLKYGRTIDLRRRMSEHRRSFRVRLPPDDPVLVYHSLIHPNYLVKAEKNIEAWFKDAHLYLENQEHTELAIVTRCVLKKQVRRQYEMLSELYYPFN